MLIRAYSINTYKSNNPAAVRDFVMSEIKNDPTSLCVFGLQEIDVGAVRSGNVNALEVIAGGDALNGGLPQFFARSIAFDGSGEVLAPHASGDNASLFEYGIGLVASHPIAQAERVALGPNEALFWQRSTPPDFYDWETEPRTAIIANMITPNGSLWVINTHLAYSPDRSVRSPLRAMQIEALLAAAKEIIPPNVPTIVMGDFNATVANPDLEPLFKQFKIRTPKGPTYTNGRGTNAQIDYICSHGLTPLPPMTAVAASFSDHKIVRALFKF
ncbi:MAG TPA: hypothetical protein DCY07_05355 [Rhodospirillaceae bacterium]|nr:hypothetical protein [Rhodospirillaceae bacterium]